MAGKFWFRKTVAVPIITFSVATDPNRIVYAKYAGKGIPRVYLIAPDGTIVYQLAGYQEEEIPKIREAVRRLLSK
jgi:hypothetical protein